MAGTKEKHALRRALKEENEVMSEVRKTVNDFSD